MERIKEVINSLDNISCDIQSLNDAFFTLNLRLTEEAYDVGRMDKVYAIEKLKERLFQEIDSISYDERISEHYFSINQSVNSLIGLAAGSVIAAFLKKENPISIGLDIYNREKAGKSCFGNVMAIVRDSNKSDDIEVVSISRIAREKGITEAMVVSYYRNKGYTVLTPKNLQQYLDNLKEDNIKKVIHRVCIPIKPIK